MQFKPPTIVSSIQKTVDAIKVNLGLEAFKKTTDAILGRIKDGF